MRMIVAAAALIAVIAGAAEAQTVKKGALSLSDLAIRATPAGLPTSAAYLTIENHGKAADTLVSVDCACADSAMMHRSETRNGVSTMSMVDAVEIPAGGKVQFKPDGLHVMLVGIKGPLKAGQTRIMTLRFKRAGSVKASFPVKDVISR